MRYFTKLHCTRLCLVLLASGLLACGGGGKSKSAVSSSTSSGSSSVPAVIPGLTLGAPTTNPVIIPPSAAAVPVKFLSVVRGSFHPESLSLDEVDKDGNILQSDVAQLKDDGTDGDTFRGDQIYSGRLLMGSVASAEKLYRVHAIHDGEDVQSGTGRFWVSGCPSVARPSNPNRAVLDNLSNSYVFANEAMVTLDSTVPPDLTEINAIMATANAHVVGCIPALNQYLVEIPDSTTTTSLYAAIASLESNVGTVVDASPNTMVTNPASESDAGCEGVACQWYLERIRAPQAWALAGGGDQQMAVAVIDFGVDCTRTDINCNGGTNSQDNIDHGTGVASLIAAHKTEGAPMTGVAWNTDIYPYSFIGQGGSQYKMSELITLSMTQESVRVINISAVTALDPSHQIRDAMCSAIDSGRLIVAAAGNASVNASNSCELVNVYPARYNSVDSCSNGANLAKGLLVVGAIDADNNLAQWSNNQLCSNKLYVDIFAPGKDVVAASANSNNYAPQNGTSFATPLVAGSAAVLWAAQPTLNVAQVHDRLIASATTYVTGSGVGRNKTQDPRLLGKPLLDLFTAVGGSDTLAEPRIVPDDFSFTAPSAVNFLAADLNSYISSERFTIQGIDRSIPISIAGGFYSIDNGPFTSAAGTVGPGHSVAVQLLSSSLPVTRRQATLHIGSVTKTFEVTTAGAVIATLNNFDFKNIVNAELGGATTSSPMQITDLPEATPISIVNGEYAIDNGNFTSAPGTVNANQILQLRVIAPATPDTSIKATVTIAGRSDDFRITTVAADTTPDAFVFEDRLNVQPSTMQSFTTIDIGSINTAANVSISGGEYSIDGADWTSTAGKVNAGQTISVRHMSAAESATDNYGALTIGTYTVTFHSRTEVVSTPINVIDTESYQFNAVNGAALNAAVTSNVITASGLSVAMPISIEGGEYSLDGGPFTNVPTTLSNGQTIQIKAIASANFDDTSIVTVHLGSAATYFYVSTLSANSMQQAF